MREIKFRLWDVDGEQWLEEDQFMIYPNGTVRAWIGEDEVKNVELTQYTGIKDKYGKEIYEGDIVSVVNMHDENIQWWANGLAIPFTIEWRYHAFELPSSEEDISFNWEVTGNIYEQPEKLTVKEGNKSNSSQG
jgi:uncharacterized phage protein (TIGR01671 family)